MTNKEFYIEEQIFFAKLNKLLILENSSEIIKNLLNDFEINKIINNIKSYLENISNIYFISYFNIERQKLIEIVQMLIFIKRRDLRYHEDFDDEYLGEEQVDNLLQIEKYLQRISPENKAIYETNLLSYRHLKISKNIEFYLKLCYIVDEDIIRYINYENEKIDITNSNYQFYIYSLFKYYYTTIITLDKRQALDKLKKIIFFNSKEFKRERIQLIYLIKEMNKREYVDLGYDDLYNDLYLDIDNADPYQYKYKGNVINIDKYKKR